MSDSTNGDYGEFAPGIGKVVGTFEFRRRRDTDEIAVYDPEAASPKPLGFAPSTIKTVGEAELWANGLRIGLDHWPQDRPEASARRAARAAERQVTQRASEEFTTVQARRAGGVASPARFRVALDAPQTCQFVIEVLERSGSSI